MPAMRADELMQALERVFAVGRNQKVYSWDECHDILWMYYPSDVVEEFPQMLMQCIERETPSSEDEWIRDAIMSVLEYAYVPQGEEIDGQVLTLEAYGMLVESAQDILDALSAEQVEVLTWWVEFHLEHSDCEPFGRSEVLRLLARMKM